MPGQGPASAARSEAADRADLGIGGVGRSRQEEAGALDAGAVTRRRAVGLIEPDIKFIFEQTARVFGVRLVVGIEVEDLAITTNAQRITRHGDRGIEFEKIILYEILLNDAALGIRRTGELTGQAAGTDIGFVNAQNVIQAMSFRVMTGAAAITTETVVGRRVTDVYRPPLGITRFDAEHERLPIETLVDIDDRAALKARSRRLQRYDAIETVIAAGADANVAPVD